MNRIMVIGCCGSGKSTFSKKLNSIIHKELIHLDQYYWKKNWKETNAIEWAVIVKELANKSEWIIDGNYGGTMQTRIEKADTIIFLDFPTWKCLWRIFKRTIKYHGKVRPDMPTGCKERFHFDFFKYVSTFNLLKRKSLMDHLEECKQNNRVEIFNSDKELGDFLNNLGCGKIIPDFR